MSRTRPYSISLLPDEIVDIGWRSENVDRTLGLIRDHRGILSVILPSRARRRYRHRQMISRAIRVNK
jgi:hypothetical protein